MASLRLVSVNIERSKHLDLFVSFLREQNADVVCIQECMERDIPLLEKAAGGTCFFTPLCIFAGAGEEQGVYGQAIISRLPFVLSSAMYYAGEHDPLFVFNNEEKEEVIGRQARALSLIEVEKDSIRFKIATTHFTWSPDGEATDRQRRDLKSLLGLLDVEKEFVLAGDFNAPRGSDIFDTLAKHYKDNIPAKYEWSLDESLHRVPREVLAAHARDAGVPGLMVDGLFSTPEYIVSAVELHTGVSDHCAITATVSKK
ncbi:endonuclease/exonuclease/phosphatase family protein [Candidatus Kaiserbacteria bacterium]|nr:endonuclease/exonuclease/phosphatase family protein [Candidatus Kaiserbacteria bacterium]